MLTADDRKAELKRRRITVAALARGLGYSRYHVHQVVAGARRNDRIERVVAAAIEMPVSEVFPPLESAPDFDEAAERLRAAIAAA